MKKGITKMKIVFFFLVYIGKRVFTLQTIQVYRK
jgi:hypothetical protein